MAQILTQTTSEELKGEEEEEEDGQGFKVL